MKITKEKVGIIKQGIPCVTIKHSKEIANVIKAEFMKKNAQLIISDDFNPLSYNPSLKGRAQFENARLAEMTVNKLLKDVKSETIINGIQNVKWYARNQIIQINPMVIFDVAHNASGIASFIDFVESLSIKNKKLILSLQRRKNIQSQTFFLSNIFNEIILCETYNKRTMKIDELKANFAEGKNIICIKSEYEACLLPSVSPDSVFYNHSL